MSPTEKTTILLVSTSDLWIVSARSVLASYPELELLETAHGSLTAYQTVLEKQPHVLIIDDSLPAEEAQTLVTNIKAAACTTYCIGVVSMARHRKAALAATADAVIARSGSSEQLITAVLSAHDHIHAPSTTTKSGNHSSPGESA